MLLSPRIIATVAAVWREGSSSHQSSKLSEWIGHANRKGAFVTRFIGHLSVCFVECEAGPKLVLVNETQQVGTFAMKSIYMKSALGVPRPQHPSLVGAGLKSSPPESGPTPFETREVWRTFASCCDVKKAFRIALISTDLQQSRRIAINLTGLGNEVHHCTDPEAMFDSVQASPQDWGLVVFDLDTAPDRKIALSDLQDFREECPELPVLILSGAARQGASTHDCSLFGGVTPQSPALPPHLIDGLMAANLNVVAVH